MTTKKETPISFMDWVLTQPPERPIRHLSWSTCSVGDYCEAVLGDRGLVNQNRRSSVSVIGDAKLESLLGNTVAGVLILTLPTYKELQEYITINKLQVGV